MPSFAKVAPPAGELIAVGPDGLKTPDHPIIPFIKGDGIGPEIWTAASQVTDAAVARAYGGRRRIAWFEIFAGMTAAPLYGPDDVMPADAYEAIRWCKAAIKGPLATPISGGIRSCNVAFRQTLDLYANVRPVRYLPGLPSPLKQPEKVDLVIFRENTEDVYAGVEWAENSPEARELIALINRKWRVKAPLPEDSAIGIKPMTKRACQRLVRRAIAFAVHQGCPSVTLVHKGNIMKFTEGGFVKWGYELAQEEFGDVVLTKREVDEKYFGKTPPGKVVVKDRIADAMFQDLILHPDEHSVIATTNLNGDYLSDAAAALVGGLGFAAGANLGDGLALFEAVHGAAPDIACQNVANPSSLMLTAIEMLRHIGWREAADLAYGALKAVVARNWLTADVACFLPNIVPLSCTEFTDAVLGEIGKG